MTPKPALMSQEEYLQKRLEDQIDWYDRKSLHHQKTFQRLRYVRPRSHA
jgi:hypothetical protein